jgi:hypothetical protein
MPTSSLLGEAEYLGSDRFLCWLKCGERTLVKIPKAFSVHRVRAQNVIRLCKRAHESAGRIA